jgi:hypothetical protein
MQEITRTGAIIILLLFLALVWLQPKPKPEPEVISSIDTIYQKQVDSFYFTRKKIIQKYDTLFICFTDTPYSTELLERSIFLHRQLDSQGCE